MTHGEMKKWVCTQVQKPLTNLVNSHAVTRQLMHSRIYVYLSVDKSKAQEQFQQRLAISDKTLGINLGLAQKLIDIMDSQSPLGQGVRRANSKLFNRRTTQS
jgi:hypothetical protein